MGDFGFNVTWSMSEDGDSYFHIVRKGTRSESKTGAGFWFLAGLDKFKDERSDDFGKPKDLEDFLATLKSADSTANLGLMELLDRIDSELADWRKVGRTSGLPKEAREKREAWRPLLQFNTAVRKELARKH